MTILNDAALLARTELVTPFSPKHVQPQGIDLHLGARLLRLPYGQELDPEQDQAHVWTEAPLRQDGRWLLGARELFLGATLEEVAVPRSMVGFLHGVSSLGRLGLLIHVTAGLIDAGNTLKPTLEIVSLGGPIYLRPGMRIAQITFHRLDGEATAYSGRYRNDTDVTPSRGWRSS